MPRKKKTDVDAMPESGEAIAEANPINGDTPAAEPSANGHDGSNPTTLAETPVAEPAREGDNAPVQVYTVPVARDTFIQVSVWEKVINLRDGVQFVSHEVSVRKRWRESSSGEWRSLHSFRCSEVYALQHVLRKAEEWILNARTTAKDCPF